MVGGPLVLYASARSPPLPVSPHPRAREQLQLPPSQMSRCPGNRGLGTFRSAHLGSSLLSAFRPSSYAFLLRDRPSSPPPLSTLSLCVYYRHTHTHVYALKKGLYCGRVRTCFFGRELGQRLYVYLGCIIYALPVGTCPIPSHAQVHSDICAPPQNGP